LQGPLRDRINAAIDTLADNPVPVGSKKLAGHDDYRIRIGDYRIVYAIDHHKRLILIARIAHRREVYRR
jgi:mRNA interferase RelE/StbE